MHEDPELAAAGAGEDVAYVGWYDRMLDATAPTGLIAAYEYSGPPPAYMYVSLGPPGVDRFKLPPPGLADDVERDAAVDPVR